MFSKDTRGRVTRRVLTGSGLLKEPQYTDDEANDQGDSPKNDFWNLSNDEYYNPRLVDSVGKNLGSLNLQVMIFIINYSIISNFSFSMLHQQLNFVLNCFLHI